MKTVKELIEKLKEFDSDTRVVVSGLEDGYDDTTEISELRVTISGRDWWNGKYRHSDKDDPNSVDAIFIG